MSKTMRFLRTCGALSMLFSSATVFAQATEPAPAASPAAAATGGDGQRPIPKTIGIGAGWLLPTDVTIPNYASARIAYSDVLILEPNVELSLLHNSVEPPGGGATSSNSTFVFRVGTQARYILDTRGPIDLAALANASFSHTSIDAATDMNSQAFILRWGLGISWYFFKGWSFSVDATNPFFTWTRTSVNMGSTTTSLLLAAIFNPNIVAAFHLYF